VATNIKHALLAGFNAGCDARQDEEHRSDKTLSAEKLKSHSEEFSLDPYRNVWILGFDAGLHGKHIPSIGPSINWRF
jgi:hypothetical protein